MSRKSWHLDRRTFLRGSGVAVAVPFLEGMTRAASLAPEAAKAKKRLCYVYFPNGAGLPKEDDPKWGQWRWFPMGEGESYRMTNVLASLEPFRKKLSILGGLSHPKSRNLLGHLAGDTWLTSGDLRGDQYKNDISADQVAAHQLKRHTRYPSLVLSTDGGVGYKSRVSTLSFDHNGRPIPSEHRQRQIFERYFAPGGGASTKARRQSLRRGKKIVDLILEDSKRLGRQLSDRDKKKLEDYLASLNSVEEQIRRNERWLDVPMKPIDAKKYELDIQAKADPKAYLRSMFDLIVLAFETDLTRVVTYMTGREDGMGFADHFPRIALGIKKGHHTISHDKAKGHWEEWGRYDRWHAEQFAYFLERMQAVRDDKGSILDQTLVLYGSCCSTTHNARNYPLALAGGNALGVKHGRFTKFDEKKVPMANLLLSMLRAVDVKAENFADSTGPIQGLFA